MGAVGLRLAVGIAGLPTPLSQAGFNGRGGCHPVSPVLLGPSVHPLSADGCLSPSWLWARPECHHVLRSALGDSM